VHFQNPKILVVCLVFLEDKVLMCRRAQEPAPGKWNAPMGYLESGETLQQGAARETYEETGVVVHPDQLDLYSIVDMAGIEQVAVVFRIELRDHPTVRPGPECSEARFLTEGEVCKVDVAWGDKMGESRRIFFQQVRAREFCIQLINTALRPGEVFNSRVYSISQVRK
jgi:ADP-ribose pyrophosphatase YjhB (NUDIX family)